MKTFLKPKNKPGRAWWVAVFFLVLAAITFPVILLSQQYGWNVSITVQAIIILATTWICQRMMKEPLSTLTGSLGRSSAKNGAIGLLIGALLMLVPALVLTAGGFISWQTGTADLTAMLYVTGIGISVAITEEFLFRGFLFRRLHESLGVWPAQFIIAGLFLLTHLSNPGMTGTVKLLAGINIFIASLAFGLAFLKTKNLLMPITMHFMANWVQGSLLGFGVSGNEQASLLKPVFNNAWPWLTGGSFGLEASVPGLVCIVLTTVMLYRWKPSRGFYMFSSTGSGKANVVAH